MGRVGLREWKGKLRVGVPKIGVAGSSKCRVGIEKGGGVDGVSDASIVKSVRLGAISVMRNSYKIRYVVEFD